MKEQGVIFRFLGDRKNLRGRYRNGSCIKTPKGYFTFLWGVWHRHINTEDLKWGEIKKKKN